MLNCGNCKGEKGKHQKARCHRCNWFSYRNVGIPNTEIIMNMDVGYERCAMDMTERTCNGYDNASWHLLYGSAASITPVI